MDDETKRMREIREENDRRLEEMKLEYLKDKRKERKTLDLMFKIWIAFVVIVLFLYIATLIISLNKK